MILRIHEINDVILLTFQTLTNVLLITSVVVADVETLTAALNAHAIMALLLVLMANVKVLYRILNHKICFEQSF
jgi:hypothetical protein